MKQLLLLTILLCSALSFNAQRKPVAKPQPKPTATPQTEVKPSQRVVIEKINGDKLTGLFVGGNAESISIDLDGSRINVKLPDIASIRFGDAPVKNDLPGISKNDEAVANALKSLRKLAAATEVGVNFQDYSSRLIDVKAEVNEVLPQIADGYVKDEIKLAMDAYADAGTAWNWTIVNRSGDMFPDYEPGKTLQAKYSIPTYKYSDLHLMERDKVLNAIWAAARKHIENAVKGKVD